MEQSVMVSPILGVSNAVRAQSKLEQRITDALRRAFPEMIIELEPMPSGRYFGTLVWDGFENEEPLNRQKCVRHVLREQLNEDSNEVGVLLTYTPNEIRAMQES